LEKVNGSRHRVKGGTWRCVLALEVREERGAEEEGRAKDTAKLGDLVVGPVTGGGE